VTEKDGFFLPEEVDKQIENVRQFKEGDPIDAEAMAYLRSYYQTDARQEQEALDRIWNRIAGAPLVEQDTQEKSEKELSMYNPHIQYAAGAMGSSRQSRSPRTSLMRQLGILAAAVLLVALVGSMTIVFYTLRQNNGSATSPRPTTSSTAGVPLKVTSVSMSVTPESIAGLTCGTNLTVTYTAIFHVKQNSVGGPVTFNYTINNGRGQSQERPRKPIHLPGAARCLSIIRTRQRGVFK